MNLRTHGWLLLLVLAACGASSAPAGIGTRHLPRERRPIELSLRTTDGRIVELADQRGSPVLLFLFATYDALSLASNRHLVRFTRAALDTIVLAVAIQPDAEFFASAFAETQMPPYTVVWDPANAILRGATDLGPIEAIPTLIMIDAHGYECARHVGYANDRVLQSMREVALARSGIVATPPGRVGEPALDDTERRHVPNVPSAMDSEASGRAD